MLRNRDNIYQAYHALLSMLLTCVFAFLLDQYFQLRVSGLFCAFISLCLAVGIYTFDYFKKNSVRYLVLVSLLPIFAFIFWVYRLNPLRLSYDLYQWCQSYNGAEDLYVAAYAYFVVTGIAMAGSILFYLLMNKELTRIILAVLTLLLLIILCVGKTNINKWIVGICVFYLVLILIELCGIYDSRKTGTQEKKTGILYLVPVCLLITIISVGLPSKEEPIQWSGVKRMYYDVKHQFELWRTDLEYYFTKGDKEFAVSQTGFTEDGGNLSEGNLTQSDKVFLKVNGKADDKPIYLTGAVSNRYTGDGWEKSGTGYIEEKDEYLLDYIELIGLLSRQKISDLEEQSLVEQETLTIEYANVKTKTLFYPIKSSAFSSMDWNTELPLLSRDSNIKFSKARREGDEYKASFFDMELEKDAFLELLRENDSFSYPSGNCFQDTTLKWMTENLIRNDSVFQMNQEDAYRRMLTKRAKMIQEEYTQLPGELPDRVKELAQYITENYSAKVDKLKAIEQFLKGYSYNLQPGSVPKGKDAVDYFLFDNQEGYCTYFASAMAVLGRCIGIPTRYVEGFAVTFQKENKDPDSSTTYLVKNNQAHAWAEAYLEGVGWIPFEATPPFYDLRYTKRKEKSNANPQYYHGTDPYGSTPGEIPEWLKNAEDGQESDRNLQDNNGVGITITIITLAVLFILVLCSICYYYIVRYQYQKNFQKADFTGRMYMLFLRILRLLKLEGYGLEPQETLLMMAGRVKGEYCFEGITYTDIVYIYMKYRYAQQEITEKELKKTTLFLKGLESRQREERSKFAYFLEEFLFLSKKSYR